MNAAVAAGRPLYHPAGATAYLGQTSPALSVPSGLAWVGDGRLSLLTSDTPAGTTFAFAQNTGWATSTAATNISVSGLRFRRTVSMAGTEGPYDGALVFRKITGLVISSCVFESGMSGAVVEGCQDYEVEWNRGYSQGDCSFRIPFYSGIADAGGGVVRGNRSFNAGFGLDGVTPVTGATVGDAFIFTQTGLDAFDNIALNPQQNALETGSSVSNLHIDGFSVICNLSGRNGSLLLQAVTDSDVRNVRLYCPTSPGRVYLPNNTCKNVQISGVKGYGMAAVTVGNGAIECNVRNVEIDAANLTYATGTPPVSFDARSATPMTLEDCKVYNAQRTGFSVLGGGVGLTRVRRCEAWDCGQTPGTVDDQIGFLIEITGGTIENCVSGNNATTQQRQGYYIPSGSWVWFNNRSVATTIAPIRFEAVTNLVGRPVADTASFSGTAPAGLSAGVATLSSGAVVVATTSVTSVSRITLTAQDNSSTGALRVSARTAGTSFTITSSNAGDSGVVAWEIREPQ